MKAEPRSMRERLGPPDFSNLLAVLERRRPARATLFEFFLNERLYGRLAGGPPADETPLARQTWIMKAFHAAGYDYATTHVGFRFPVGSHERKDSISLNEHALVTDRESFDAFPWPDPRESDYSLLEAMKPSIPAGMKLIVPGPGGVLENVIQLTGFDNLCYLTVENPRLVHDIVDAVGARLVEHYRILAGYDTVGAMISNDDWGFRTQTMLSPAQMREFVFPWHQRIVETIHDAGRPAILHSCGQLEEVMDGIIDELGYDGKHSYEDTILPVEQAYERWGGRIAILGGIDLDFVCRRPLSEITARGRAMLEQTRTRGGYALGSGNSIPEYVPDENYFAMTGAA